VNPPIDPRIVREALIMRSGRPVGNGSFFSGFFLGFIIISVN
jgi:hypothetical protein